MGRVLTKYSNTDSPRRSWWSWVFLLFGVSLIGVVLFGFLWVQNFLKSDAFRKLVSDAASKPLLVEGEFVDLRWSGESVFSNRFTAKGKPGSAIERMDADLIRADVSLGRLWERNLLIQSINITKLDIVFDDSGEKISGSELDLETQSLEVTEEKAGKLGAGEKSGNFFDWFKPQKMEVKEIRVDSANLRWLGEVPGKIQGTEFLIYLEHSGIEASGKGGKLELHDWPEAKIEDLRFRYRNGVIYLTRSQFQLEEGGTLEADGEIHFQKENGRSLVNLKLARVPVSQWLSGDWISRLKGDLSGTLELREEEALWRSKGTLELQNAVLEGLPLLEKISKYTRMPEFMMIRFQTAKADFEYVRGVTDVKNILLEAEGLLRVEGSLRVVQGQVEGDMQVGVASRSLQWIPGAEAKVFTESRGGYVWTNVHVQGPMDQPEEDLSGRLMQAAVDSLIETPMDIMRNILPGTGTKEEESKGTVEQVEDAVKGISKEFFKLVP